MKKFYPIIAITLLVILSACGTSQNSSNENQENLDFGAATQGGFWYTLAAAMGDEFKKEGDFKNVDIIEGGSISNLIAINDGEFDIGFATGQDIPNALEGNPPFDNELEDIKWIATLYPSVFQIVVREDSNIESIEDLKGKNVSPGIKGYGAELTFQEMLDIHDMSYDDLNNVEFTSVDDAADLLRDGHIDAIIGIVDAPLGTFTELDSSLGIDVLNIPEDTIKELKNLNEGYQDFTIDSGTYNNESEIETLAVNVSVFAKTDLSEDAAYEITKVINENKENWVDLSKTMEDFDSDYSVENQIGEIHPGAKKYYEE